MFKQMQIEQRNPEIIMGIDTFRQTWIHVYDDLCNLFEVFKNILRKGISCEHMYSHTQVSATYKVSVK